MKEFLEYTKNVFVQDMKDSLIPFVWTWRKLRTIAGKKPK
jgi:hypothetical protein